MRVYYVLIIDYFIIICKTVTTFLPHSFSLSLSLSLTVVHSQTQNNLCKKQIYSVILHNIFLIIAIVSLFIIINDFNFLSDLVNYLYLYNNNYYYSVINF